MTFNERDGLLDFSTPVRERTVFTDWSVHEVKLGLVKRTAAGEYAGRPLKLDGASSA